VTHLVFYRLQTIMKQPFTVFQLRNLSSYHGNIPRKGHNYLKSTERVKMPSSFNFWDKQWLLGQETTEFCSTNELPCHVNLHAHRLWSLPVALREKNTLLPPSLHPPPPNSHSGKGSPLMLKKCQNLSPRVLYTRVWSALRLSIARTIKTAPTGPLYSHHKLQLSLGKSREGPVLKIV
jgi:hypothetical protein